MPTVRTRTLATSRSIAASAGRRSRTSGERSSSRWVVVAPMREVAVRRGDAAQLRDAFEVDEVVEGREAELHQQEQLRAAAVEQRLVAVLDEQRRGLLDRAGPVQVERGKGHGAVAAAGRARMSSGRLDAGADLDRHAEVREGAADRGEPDDRVERPRRRRPCGRCGRGCRRPARPRSSRRSARGSGARTCSWVRPSGTVIAVTQAAAISSLARPQLESHGPHAGARGLGRQLVLGEARLEPFAQQDARRPPRRRRGRRPTGVNGNLLAVDPLLLPVEHRQERAARRGRVGADALPRPRRSRS